MKVELIPIAFTNITIATIIFIKLKNKITTVTTLTALVWKEGNQYVSKCPELEVASCGDTLEEALENLKEAVELYIENAKELGMLEDELEAVFSKKFITTFEVTI